MFPSCVKGQVSQRQKFCQWCSRPEKLLSIRPEATAHPDPDKKAQDADTIDTVRAIYAKQDTQT
jgi:hypothetical protein